MDQTTRRRVYTLRFENHGDLTVRTRKPGFRSVQLCARAVRALGEGFEGAGLPAHKRIRAWAWLFEAFSDSLIDWDLTDFGKKVPPTRDGVFAQDHDLLLDLARAWYLNVAVRREKPDPVPEPPSRPVEPAAATSAPALTTEDLALMDLPVEVFDPEADWVETGQPAEVPEPESSSV